MSEIYLPNKEQIDRMIELQKGIGKEYTIYDGVPTTKDVIIELQEGNFAIVEVERLKLNSVSLQVSNDGVNWYSVSAKSMQTGHTTNRIFTTGRYVVNITGSKFVRCSLYYQPTNVVRVKLITTMEEPKVNVPLYRPRKTLRPSELFPEFTSIKPQYSMAAIEPETEKILSYTGNAIYISEDWGETFQRLWSCPNVDGSVQRVEMLNLIETGEMLVGTNKGNLFKTDTNYQNPRLVLTAEASNSYFDEAFGFSAFRNMLLIAEYTNKNNLTDTRNVWLSYDYGETWTKIFAKEAAPDFHIHDVQFDPYESLIWITVGDDAHQQIYWSDDFGTSWKEVWDDFDEAPGHFAQVMPLPNCVLFVSDTRQVAVYRYDRPTGGIQTLDKVPIEPAWVLYPRTSPSEFFGGKVVCTYDNPATAYFGFRQHYSSVTTHTIVYATTDGYEFYPIWQSKYKPEGTVGYRGIGVIDGPTKSGYLAVQTIVKEGSDEDSLIKLKLPNWV